MSWNTKTKTPIKQLNLKELKELMLTYILDGSKAMNGVTYNKYKNFKKKGKSCLKQLLLQRQLYGFFIMLQTKLKVLDLFSGIGGFSLGLESTGFFETIAFVEKDEFCQKVLKKNFNNIPIEGDIRNVKGDLDARNVVINKNYIQELDTRSDLAIISS